MLRVFIAAIVLFVVGLSSLKAQNINLPSNTLSVKEAFDAIQDQTSYRLMYGSKAFNTSRNVTFPATTLTLEQVLGGVLKGSGFTYSQRNEYLIIKQLPKQEAKRAEPMVSSTGDIYKRSNQSADNPAQTRRRFIESPNIDIVKPAEIYPDSVRTEEPPVFTSLVTSVESYINDKLPNVAVRTNMAYWATMTPNLSVEVGTGRRTSLKLGAGYNPWNRKGSVEDNKKLVHFTVTPEFRYWMCNRFNGHFVGIHAIASKFNVGEHNISLLDFKKEYRYEGHAFGGGVNYGYHMMLSKRWGLEFSAGVGVLAMKYDRYECAGCSHNGIKENKTYFGPTQLGVNLVFMIK